MHASDLGMLRMPTASLLDDSQGGHHAAPSSLENVRFPADMAPGGPIASDLGSMPSGMVRMSLGGIRNDIEDLRGLGKNSYFR